ncbi:MAG: hypothetical protein ACFE0I_19355 [Elainellaceae cyanobacterium]
MAHDPSAPGDRPPSIKPMAMYLQDPTLPELRDHYDFSLDDDFLIGTGSSRFMIRDANENDLPVFPSSDWSRQDDLSFDFFEKQGLVDNPFFHQVNTFAVVNRTLDLVEEELGHSIVWKDGGPLVIRPHAFEGMNAYYSPSPQSLNFGYFSSPFRRTPVWTCLSHDIVSHELGHAILDTLRPLYVYGTDIDTHALHESLADLLAMFSALEHPSVVNYLYAETGGEMRDPSLITRLAEEFGTGIYGTGVAYLRSALEGVNYESAPKESHSRSKTWTAAIYEILENLVRQSHPDGFAATYEGANTFADALVQAIRWIKGMLFRAFHYMPPSDISMPLLARLIYEADARVFPEDERFREIAVQVFQQRGIWNYDLAIHAPDIGETFRGLEHANARMLARAVIQQADALRIPLWQGVRLLNPRLITTKRQIDKIQTGQDGESSVVKEITEHYLEYTYEMLEPIGDVTTGETVMFAVHGGGTLVMDENWKALFLVTYPESLGGDLMGQEGVMQAWQRTRERFQEVHQDSIQRTVAARHEERTVSDRPVIPGCPFVVQQDSAGAHRLVRRACHLQEHLKGIQFNRYGITQ